MSNDVQKVVLSLLTHADAIEQEATRVWAMDPAYSAVEVAQLKHRAAILRDRAAALESRAEAWAAYNASQPTTQGRTQLESAEAMAAYYRDLAVKCPEAAPQLLKSAALWDARVLAIRSESTPAPAVAPQPVRPTPVVSEMWRRTATVEVPEPAKQGRFSSMFSRLSLFARS